MDTLKRFETKWEKVARVFSRDLGVTVRLAGNTCAKTDGKTIIIPANADHLDQVAQETMEGLFDHEWKHVEEESIAREKQAKGIDWPSPLAMLKAAKDKRTRQLINVFEDIRIEEDASKRFLGVAQNLAKSNKHLLRRLAKDSAKGLVDKWLQLTCGIIARARKLDDSFVTKPVRDILDQMEDIIQDSLKAVNAYDSLALSKRVLARLEEIKAFQPEPKPEPKAKPEPKPRNPMPPSSGDDCGEMEEGDEVEFESDPETDQEAESNGKSKSKSKDEDKDEPEGEEKPDNGGASSESDESDKQQEPSEDAKGAAEELLESDAASEDVRDRLREDITKASSWDVSCNSRHMVHPDVKDVVRSPLPSRHEELYRNILKKVRPQVAALRSKMLAILRSKSESVLQGDKDGGVIDSSSLYGLRHGERRIFAQRTEAETIDVAVQVVVDLSGSMMASSENANMHSKSDYARASCIAIVECLQSLGIPVEVLGFHCIGARSAFGDDGCYNRYSPVNIEVLKPFEKNLKQSRQTIVTISGSGDNVDGDSLLLCAPRLMARPESRKIMMVLSDGRPRHTSSNNDLLEKHLTEVVERLRKAGVEVFGLGIQANAVSKFYPDFAVVYDLDGLAKAVFQMMKRYLVGGRRRKVA